MDRYLFAHVNAPEDTTFATMISNPPKSLLRSAFTEWFAAAESVHVSVYVPSAFLIAATLEIPEETTNQGVASITLNPVFWM